MATSRLTSTDETAAVAQAAAPARKGGAGPPGEPRRIGYLYVLPALLVYGAFLLFPLVHSFWISLYDWNGQTLATWVGFANYVDIVRDAELRSAFGHALVLIFFYAVVPIVLALALTAAMSRARVRGLTFFRTALFLPQVVAMVVVATAWSAIYAPSGVLNTVLQAIGLGALARPWLGDFTWALPSVGLIGTWVEIGLALVLFMAGVQRIPRELYEAARLDGAGPVREFFAITLPSLRGEISVALTLTIVAALRTFDLVYIATHGGPGTATTVPAFQVYHRAFETNQVGSACAIGVTLAVVILLVTVLVNRLAEGRDQR
ncbi:MAG: sugar ABC transporter permease [Streptosporangiales bacterium]|nr:sugar ABC transporter permease [Streptosporangiales bacterium]MBO0889752.1 sugar ABC transporter permease [Acidothermales bacterium]